MTDDRPRPKYGEYAPEGWVSPVAAHAPVDVPVGPPAVAATRAARPRRTWDLALTVALLTLGLYSVLSGYLSFTDAPALFRQAFELLEIGTFTSDDAARSAGITINVVQTVIWLAATALAVVSLRRGRLAWVWPLAGGVLANIIVGVIVGVVMAGDPAYVEYLGQLAP